MEKKRRFNIIDICVLVLVVAIANILGYGEMFKEQVQFFFHGQDMISEKLLGFAEIISCPWKKNCTCSLNISPYPKMFAIATISAITGTIDRKSTRLNSSHLN